MVAFESIYPGAEYLLDPEYEFTGYQVPAGELGGTTGIQTANQLREVTRLLNQGVKNTEVSVIDPNIFEMMPKDHLKEIHRLNKLTGAESTLHAPIQETDPSGMTDKGWSEDTREMVERRLKDVVLRSHDINPKGNIPVTIHSSSIPGSELIPTKDGEEYGKMVIVDKDSGRLQAMSTQEEFDPERGKSDTVLPKDQLKRVNREFWDQSLSQLIFYKERGDAILRDNFTILPGTKESDYTPEQKIAADRVKNAKIYLDQTYDELRNIYKYAYNAGDANAQKAIQKAGEVFKKEYEPYQKDPQNLLNISAYSSAVQKLISSMQDISSHHTLRKFVPVEEFATEKTSETLSNVALDAYKKFGKTSPIISIENPPYGTAIATGKELKHLIKETQRKFVQKAVQLGKLNKSEAEQTAHKLIGATWDTSHISMIRKQGFGKERLIEEAKEIAPHVKHVHFNDNFGTTHTDLPPGMGTVPMKEIMEEFEKIGFKGKKIFEGGNFVQNFQTSPVPFQLRYSGSPLYKENGPQWNQLGAGGNYYSGFGDTLPQKHFQTYGSGFMSTEIPVELGGNIPGGQSRFSGTPNT